MKNYSIPPNASRDQRDILMARMIRHITRVQRSVERIQADQQKQEASKDHPSC